MARFTRLLIIINVAVFALEAVSGSGLLANFALWPVGHFIVAQFDRPVGFKLWQLITCGFLHANFLHLAINMYALWMFGSDVERAVGPRRYLTLYFASLVCSSATQLLVVSMMTSAGVYPTVDYRRTPRSQLRGTPTVLPNLRLLTLRFANSNQFQTLSLSSFLPFRYLLSDRNSRPNCILSPAHLETSALH